MTDLIEKVARELDRVTEDALVTHGKFKTTDMAKEAITTILREMIEHGNTANVQFVQWFAKQHGIDLGGDDV